MKLFQIYESDLALLETALPRIQQALGVALNRPDVHTIMGEVKEILSNVRWDYGPHTEVTCIPGKPPEHE